MVLLRAKETTTATVATTGLADGEASRGISGCAWRSRSGSWSLWRIGNRPPSVMPSWISWGGRQWGRDETLGPWSTVSFIWVNLWWNRVKHCPIFLGDGWMSIFWPIEDDDGCSEVLQAPHLYASTPLFGPWKDCPWCSHRFGGVFCKETCVAKADCLLEEPPR